MRVLRLRRQDEFGLQIERGSQRARERQPLEHVRKERADGNLVGAETNTFTWMRAMRGGSLSPTTSR